MIWGLILGVIVGFLLGVILTALIVAPKIKGLEGLLAKARMAISGKGPDSYE